MGVLHSQDFLLSAGAVVAGLGLKHTDLNHLVTGAGVGGGRSPSVGRTVVGGIVVSATAGQHGQQILFMFTTPFHSGIKRFTDCLPCKNTCTQDMMALYLVTQKKAIWNANYF